jgi:hypothetical protein
MRVPLLFRRLDFEQPNEAATGSHRILPLSSSAARPPCDGSRRHKHDSLARSISVRRSCGARRTRLPKQLRTQFPACESTGSLSSAARAES